MEHIEAFYGRALIESYEREHKIQCTGLFIENDLVSYTGVFETDKYDNRSYYVHLLEYVRHIRLKEGSYFVGLERAGFGDVREFLLHDITYLKNIHAHMSDMDLPPRVRVKYLSAWQMIQKRNRVLLDLLERSNFDPRSVGDLS